MTVRAELNRSAEASLGEAWSRYGGGHVHYNAFRMSKDRTYSWRLSASLKEALKDAARVENTSVARLLDRIAGEWLARGSSRGDDEAVQRRLHEAAAPFIGSVRGGDPNRAQEASRRVRAKLVGKHAR